MSEKESLQRTIEPSEAMTGLHESWDEMISNLQQAREAIDTPALNSPSSTDRNLAQGYRYLLGFVSGSFERAFGEDPNYPYFRRAIPPLQKATADNADNLYLSARIDGNAAYRISGTAKDCRHWQAQPPASSGETAPWYVIFSAITHYTGDSGELTELVPGVTVNTGALESVDMQMGENGEFEILMAPERPEGYNGNFISSQVTQDDGSVHTAQFLICRELFADWERAQALSLHIVKLGNEGVAPPPINPATAIENMTRMGVLVKRQMRFWNDFYSTLLNHYGDSPLETPYSFPTINEVIQPSPPSAAVGAAQQTNIYSGGTYQLEQDDALIIEQRIPVKALYTAFNLCNWWGESYDYANYSSSLNNAQALPDSDGVIRYVIAHRDPGVPNWLDTTGYPDGMMSQRWVYPILPDELPEVTCKKVKINDIRDHLPDDTASISAEQRREIIRVRQEHVQRRYRQY